MTGHASRRIVFSAAIATLLLAAAANVALWYGMEALHQETFQDHTAYLATVIDDALMHSPPSGIVTGLGLGNQRVKGVATGVLPIDSPGLVASLQRIREETGASILYIMNRSGDVVACTPYGNNETLTGNNYRFRAYFQRALEGQCAAYLALGVTTNRRGLYYAAPVYHSAAPAGPSPDIVGAVVMKLPLTRIDALLKASSDAVSLVTPQGIVFASNRPDWVFNALHTVDLDALRATRDRPEYSGAFFLSRVNDLGIDTDARRVAVEGRQYAVTHLPIPIPDPAGKWSLVALRETAAWFPLWPFVLLTATIALLGATTTLSQVHRRARNAAEERAREALRAHRDELEDEVRKRTRELVAANERLVHEMDERRRAVEHENTLQKRLASASRMESLGVLVGGIAHDMNNILGPIVGIPELLQDEIEHPARGTPDRTFLAEQLGILQSSGNRAADLIRDLMALGRRGTFKPEPMDVNAVVREYLQGHASRRRKTDEHAPAIRAELADEPLWIESSTPHFVRGLSNLVSNAMEALDGGAGRVTVRTGTEAFEQPHMGYEIIPRGRYAVLSVSDTGKGIDAETLQRVFEPFYTRKRQSERSGTGLGLTIVHGLVKDSAGYVDVISREGEGTTFKLYFPIADAPAADEPVPDGIPGGEGRVLVVDDEPSQRFLAETSLRRLGYEVDVCANGAEALQHVDESVSGTEDGIFGSRSGYDLVILDVIMENGPDGIETCTKVLERFPEQAVLMMSGCTPDKRIEELLSRGVGWIAKPYRLATLAAAVHERIDTARADRSP